MLQIDRDDDVIGRPTEKSLTKPNTTNTATLSSFIFSKNTNLNTKTKTPTKNFIQYAS